MKHIGFLFIVLVLKVCVLTGFQSSDCQMPLFKDEAMQDSLRCYFDKIDSIPNAYGAPSLFAISFNLLNQDSLIRFSANASLWKKAMLVDTTDWEIDIDNIVERLMSSGETNLTLANEMNLELKDDEPHWIGLYHYGKKHILLEADWDPSSFINWEALESCDDFVKQYHNEEYTGCDMTFYWYNCEKTFLFRGPNLLILKHRRIGKADPNYKDHPMYIDY